MSHMEQYYHLDLFFLKKKLHILVRFPNPSLTKHDVMLLQINLLAHARQFWQQAEHIHSTNRTRPTEHTVPKIICISAWKPSLSRFEQMQLYTVQYMYCFWSSYCIWKQNPDIYCCICSNRGRLGFYAEIQNIFGTV